MVLSLQSLNGVYVNDTRLAPNTPQLLEDKDIVRLGVPPEEKKEAEFVWQYCQAAKVVRNAKKYKQERDRLSEKPEFDSQKTIEGTSQECNSQDHKRIRSPSDGIDPQPGPSGMSPYGKPPLKR